MISTVWLKISAKKSYGRWAAGPVHAFKTKPTCRDTEVAIKISLEIPDEIFEEPVFEATVVLPKTTRQIPEKIEIGKGLGEALSKQLGFRVKIDMSDSSSVPEDIGG